VIELSLLFSGEFW